MTKAKTVKCLVGSRWSDSVSPYAAPKHECAAWFDGVPGSFVEGGDPLRILHKLRAHSRVPDDVVIEVRDVVRFFPPADAIERRRPSGGGRK